MLTLGTGRHAPDDPLNIIRIPFEIRRQTPDVRFGSVQLGTQCREVHPCAASGDPPFMELLDVILVRNEPFVTGQLRALIPGGIDLIAQGLDATRGRGIVAFGVAQDLKGIFAKQRTSPQGGDPFLQLCIPADIPIYPPNTPELSLLGGLLFDLLFERGIGLLHRLDGLFELPPFGDRHGVLAERLAGLLQPIIRLIVLPPGRTAWRPERIRFRLESVQCLAQARQPAPAENSIWPISSRASMISRPPSRKRS